MTNKEAIERLNLMQERCCNGYDAEAINYAIKAICIVEIIEDAFKRDRALLIDVDDWIEIRVCAERNLSRRRQRISDERQDSRENS